jgi:hypothetical protein
MRRSVYLSDKTEERLKTLGVGWSRAIEQWAAMQLAALLGDKKDEDKNG